MILKDVPLKTRFLITPLIYVCLTFILFLTSSSTIDSKNDIINTLKNDDLPKVAALSRFSIQLSNNITHLSSLLTSAIDDPDEERLYIEGKVIINQLHEIEKELEINLAQSSMINHENSNLLDLISNAFLRYRDASVGGIELATVDSSLSQRELLNATTEVEKLNTLLVILSEHYISQIEVTTKSIESSLGQSKSITIVATLMLLLMLFVALYFSHNMSKQIQLIYKALIALSKGQPVENLPKRSNNLIQELTQAIYKFDTALKESAEHKLKLEKALSTLKYQKSQLLESKIKAEQAAQAKSDFLALMSHEIRTPMNGVLGMLGLLQNDGLSSEQHHKVLVAESSAQSLLALINDILDLSKVDAGKLELEEISFNLLELLGNFSEIMALKAQEKGVELILDVMKVEQTYVKGDPNRIRQVLSNIVGNAIKFTEQGEIVIRAKLIPRNNDELLLKCEVTDTGIGIDKALQPNLFEMFTQADASTTRKYGGTGLGLAIAKMLCELMGGSIKVESNIGKGTTFKLSFILNISQQTTGRLPKFDISHLTILIVDDNKTNREVLRGQLSHWGANVIEADSGSMALDILNKDDSDLDVAFLDMQMPNMDGAELGSIIRSEEKFNDLKLIMMTSMAQPGDAKFFAEIGFNAYFPKPATVSDLFDSLTIIEENGEHYKNAVPSITQDYPREQPSNQNLNDFHSADQINTWPVDTRILLVEDNRVNQIVTQGVLKTLSLSADIAADGSQALKMLRNSSKDNLFTLIFMDCQMPVMDGYQATQNIRNGLAGEHYKSIPIIAMTANAMVGDKDKCFQAGMNDYLSKPLVNQDLEMMLKEWLK